MLFRSEDSAVFTDLARPAADGDVEQHDVAVGGRSREVGEDGRVLAQVRDHRLDRGVVDRPAAADERVVFERLANGAGPVTAETVISGPGLERIYRAINPFGIPLEARTIVAQARTGAAEQRAAIDLFVRLLGRFAGDIALAFKATGGVYIAGGVALKLGPLFNAATFRAAFENHPPYRDLLAAIPTWLITCNEPGLVGCAAVAERVVGAQRIRAAG